MAGDIVTTHDELAPDTPQAAPASSPIVRPRERPPAVDEPESPDATELVPDCNGGKIRAPLWLTRVPVWGALCVHAPSKVHLNIDIGTNLVAHSNLGSGDAATYYQVYYALSKARVMQNEKRLIWAVCGGGGVNLERGARAVPAAMLPAATAALLVKHINQLIDMDAARNKYWRLYRSATDPDQKAAFRELVDKLDVALTDAAGLLRAALIKENHAALAQPAAPKPLPKPGRTPRGIPQPEVIPAP